VESYIPYIRHSPVTDEEKQYVLRALDGPLTKGLYVEELERLFCAKYSKKYAVACSSGTAALHLAYGAVGKEGFDIPVVTFRSTLSAYEEMFSNTSNLIEINRDSWCAVGDVKVSLGGYVPTGRVVVEDACHAFDSFGVGDAEVSCFSLHAIKNLGVGEGGMCITDNEGAADYMIRARDPALWNGLNFRMPEMTAALAVARFNTTYRQKRRLIRERYKQELGDVVRFQVENGGECWHLCIIRSKRVEKIKKTFEERSIGWQKHYRPLTELFSEANRYWRECLSIPFFPTLTTEEQDRVIKAVRDA